MGHPLFDLQLQLLIQASPLGIWPDSEATARELNGLVAAGLLRAEPLGRYLLTTLGSAVLAMNILGRRERRLACASSRVLQGPQDEP